MTCPVMPLARTLPAVVVSTVLLVMVAAGLVWWSAAWTKADDFEQGVRTCVAAMARHDPARDARAALARGDDRLHFVVHNGFVLSITADGVPPATYGECRWRERGATRPPLPGGSLPLPFDDTYADRGPRCCDIDPELTACGRAQRAYIEAYNAEIVRLNPASVDRYCQPREGNS